MIDGSLLYMSFIHYLLYILVFLLPFIQSLISNYHSYLIKTNGQVNCYIECIVYVDIALLG